jgi:hypothetical protein
MKIKKTDEIRINESKLISEHIIFYNKSINKSKSNQSKLNIKHKIF